MFRLLLVLTIISYSSVIATTTYWDTRDIAQMFIDHKEDEIPPIVKASCSSEHIEQIRQLGYDLIAQRCCKDMKECWLPVAVGSGCMVGLLKYMSTHSNSACLCDAEGKIIDETGCILTRGLALFTTVVACGYDTVYDICRCRYEQRIRFENRVSKWANIPSAASSRSMHIAQGTLSRSERVCALIGRQYLALYGIRRKVSWRGIFRRKNRESISIYE